MRCPTVFRWFGTPSAHRAWPALGLILLACLAFGAAGCTVAALAARAAGVNVKPSYTGLRGQSIGVMVAADPALSGDFPTLSLDIAQGVQQKLQGAQKAKDKKVTELEGATFPRSASPEAILAFQRNYPETRFEPITQIAPRIGVTRLIYVDVDRFQTHPADVPELYRGEISARVQVIEVSGGVGKVAFENQITAAYPPKSPEQGMPDIGEDKTRRGTIDEFTTAVMKKFITYQEEE